MPVLSLSEAVLLRNAYADTGRTVVFTNGHFDLLHIGHIQYLQAARKLGDALIVGINGDESTRRLKGAGRPFTPANERAALIDALKPVTAAVVFEEDTANAVIEMLRPDVYVKGGDYHDKPLPERELVENLGGRIVLIDLVPERSTTALIARIRAAP
ncbi:MAG: adenylyltransferase/cytidyltransferase family protein [Chloroflexi bacterium]|nr:adenylyltransferase/cytidyltransferase family protein [Chloroflexota bacterium]